MFYNIIASTHIVVSRPIVQLKVFVKAARAKSIIIYHVTPLMIAATNIRTYQYIVLEGDALLGTLVLKIIVQNILNQKLVLVANVQIHIRVKY